MAVTREQLIEYLSAVKELEQQRYTLEKSIELLRSNASQLGHHREYALEKERFYGRDFSEIFAGIIVGALFGFGILSVISFVSKNYTFGGCLKTAGIGAIIGAVVGIIVLICDAASKRSKVRYNNQLHREEYESNVRQDDARVYAELMERERINYAIACLTPELDNVRNTLAQLYSVGILYPKYHWDIVAISEFLEYLSSGQCYGLVLNGNDDGAYKIYENRILMKQILSKLDDVLRNLEQIRYNQYLVYQTLQEATGQIDKLTGSVKSSAKQLQQGQEVANYQLKVQSKCLSEMAKLPRYRYYRSLF